MNPTQIECNLACPEDGQQVTVMIDFLEDGRRSVSNCTQFGDRPVTCAQQCLASATQETRAEQELT